MLRSLCALLLLATPALAQQTVSTAAYGPADPDTIYGLAVDSAAYPDMNWIYLLDDGVLVFEEDGRGRKTYHQIIQVLTPVGAKWSGELSYSFLKGRENLLVNWIRVVKPDGEVISEGASHEQESVVPASTQYPVYTDWIERRYSLAGVAPGTIVDVSYTTETLEPFMPRHFSSKWVVKPAVPVKRSRLVLDVPASLRPHIREVNLDFERQTLERDGRTVYSWTKQDIEPIEPELFTTWPHDGSMEIAVAGGVEWEDVARWYSELARDRYELTPKIEAHLSTLVAGARTLEDSLRAVHRWITRDIRYVSLSLGIGGYQPRTPAEVFKTKSGDCKDKTTMFIAMARRLGVEAYPVLVHQGGLADSLMPSIDEFDHLIAAIPRPDGYRYTDLTAESVPFGSVPSGLQGGFALAVHPDGRAQAVTIPADPPEANRSQITVLGQLLETGEFVGRYEQLVHGASGHALRAVLRDADRLKDRDREQVLRNMANFLYAGAHGDSLKSFNVTDPDAPLRVTFSLRAREAATAAGRSYVLKLPIANLASPAVVAVAGLEAELPRKYSIDAEQVIGPGRHEWTFRVALPHGWTAELPRNIAASSRFGTYSAEYSQSDGVLEVRRQIEGRRGVMPPEHAEELIEWLRAMSQDNVPFLLVSPPSGS